MLFLVSYRYNLSGFINNLPQIPLPALSCGININNTFYHSVLLRLVGQHKSIPPAFFEYHESLLFFYGLSHTYINVISYFRNISQVQVFNK